MSDVERIVIFDGHNDTLLDLYMPSRGEGRSFFEISKTGHLDLPRARIGNFGGGFFAIFVPRKKKAPPGSNRGSSHPEPQLIEPDYAREITQGMIDLLFQLEEEAQGELKVVLNSDDLVQCLSLGSLAAVMHFEGAEPIDADLGNLGDYYDAGLRSLGLTWSRSNAFAHGVPFEFPSSPDTGPGLTPAGEELVKACNQSGIMIDLSHLNEKGFWDVAALSDSPLVATHSGCHALCPSTRNLTDTQLDAIGESGGIVGINFHVGFLRSDGKADPDTPLSQIVRHAQYVADRIGIDHVAFGSDFDGATMPDPLGDVAGLPRLVQAFADAGFDNGALHKIGHENWQRVLAQTWRR